MKIILNIFKNIALYFKNVKKKTNLLKRNEHY